jgi:hypothetical protein
MPTLLSPSQIPDGLVQVVTTYSTFRRSRNGATLPGSTETTEVLVSPETAARRVASHSAGSAYSVQVTWPDGYSESFDFFNTPLRFDAFGPGLKTRTSVFPAFKGTDGKDYPEWRTELPVSRLGTVGYYRLELVS